MQEKPIPIWVKSILIIALGLFGFELLNFNSTFSDAVQKVRAEKAYFNSNYLTAIEGFEDLLTRHPEHKNFTMKLGLSYYKEGSFYKALSTLKKLENEEFSQSELKTLEAAISDMLQQLDRSESSLKNQGVYKS